VLRHRLRRRQVRGIGQAAARDALARLSFADNDSDKPHDKNMALCSLQ
jgi:hypothetical protein